MDRERSAAAAAAAAADPARTSIKSTLEQGQATTTEVVVATILRNRFHKQA